MLYEISVRAGLPAINRGAEKLAGNSFPSTGPALICIVGLTVAAIAADDK